MNKYIAFDCETGGIQENSTLLTSYFAILDESFNIKDELELKTKPDDEIYQISSTSMKINKINLNKHDECSIKYKIAKPILYNFLKKNSEKLLIPIGHNIKSDINKITKTLISENSWFGFVSYEHIDTSVILRLLKDLKLINENINCGLESIAKGLNIEFNYNLHEAKNDTILTIEVYKKMLTIIHK